MRVCVVPPRLNARPGALVGHAQCDERVDRVGHVREGAHFLAAAQHLKLRGVRLELPQEVVHHVAGLARAVRVENT
jgi:hypothetical protein